MGDSLKKQFLNSQLSKKVLFECLFFAGLFVLLYYWYLPYSQVFPYGDDLRSIVATLNDLSLGELLTTAGINYRPVTSIIFYVCVHAFKFNMQGYFIFNLLFQCIIALILYKKIASITEHRILGMIIALLYAISNFGFYCILQAEGLMELMCMLFVVMFMSALYDILYGDVKKLFSACCLAEISYALVTFTHERFIILAIPLLLTLFFRRKDFLDKKTYVFISALGILPLLLNVLIKVFIFNIPFFRGTAGTVMDLNSPSALENIFTHVAYMFGIHNNKLQHMDGILSSQVHPIINIVISLSIMSIIALLTIYVYLLVSKKIAIIRSVYFVLICIITIGVMIASSSFTIYVEIRWVYGPFLVALVLLSYIIKIILEFFKWKSGKNTILSCSRIILVTVLVYLFSTASYSFYYRHYFPGIFFIQWHEKGEIMYEKFLTPYENYFQSMSTILIDSAPHISSRLFLDEYGLEYNRGAFYSLFEADYKNIDFIAVADMKDINFTEIEKPLLLLYYDNIAKAIIPIVNELSKQEDSFIYQSGIIKNGFFDDGWMGKTASIYLVQPKASSIRLAGHCPDNFPNNSLIVTVNGNESVVDIIPGKSFDFSVDFENTGELIIMELVSDVVFNPAKEGTAADGRDLGVCIEIIELSREL